jgi:broad specificity phosphatase PhoE
LTDINYGRWEGLSDEEVKKRFSELYERWHSAPHQVRFPDGENLIMVKRRVLHSLEEIRLKHPDQTVLVVSHRAPIKVIICAMLGLSNKRFWKIIQDNCAYNIIILSEKESLVALLNDTCHLRSAGVAPTLPDF